MEIYQTLEQYIEGVSLKFSPNVKLKNVQNLFLIFGVFQMLILLVFALDAFLFRQLQKINRQLVRCSAIIFHQMILQESLFSTMAVQLRRIKREDSTR